MPAAATIVVDAAMLAASFVKRVQKSKTATGLPPLVLTSGMVVQPSNVIHTSCC
jgi:hypothetical protein